MELNPLQRAFYELLPFACSITKLSTVEENHAVKKLPAGLKSVSFFLMGLTFQRLVPLTLEWSVLKGQQRANIHMSLSAVLTMPRSFLDLDLCPRPLPHVFLGRVSRYRARLGRLQLQPHQPQLCLRTMSPPPDRQRVKCIRIAKTSRANRWSNVLQSLKPKS